MLEIECENGMKLIKAWMRKLTGTRVVKTPAPPLIEGLRVVDAIVAVAEIAGIIADPNGLMAALPISNDDLPIQLGSIALARVGLQGVLSARAINMIRPVDCPALLALNDGTAVIIQSLENELWTLLTANGIGKYTPGALANVYTGHMLSIAHADPVNGGDVDHDKTAIAAKPKTWLILQFLSQKKLMMQLALTAILLNICTLSIPLYMRAIYDRVVPNQAVASMWALSIGVFIVLVFEFCLKSIKSNFIDALSMRIGAMTQHRVMTSLLSARLLSAPQVPGGVLSSLRDAELIASLVPSAIITLGIDLPFFIFFVLLMYTLGGATVLAALIGGFIIIASGTVANLKLNGTSRRGAELVKARSNLIVDVVEGLATIKLSLSQGRFLRSWNLLSDHVATSGQKSRHWSELPAYLSAFTMQFVTVMVVIIGIYELRAGRLTTGGLIASTMLAGRAMVPLSNAVTIVAKCYQSLTSFTGLSTILSLSSEPDKNEIGAEINDMSADLNLVDISVRYATDQALALSHITLQIKPGERVALVGKSGSGKTTLMQALANLLPVESGRVTLDGYHIDQFAVNDLRRLIAYAPQDGRLFDMSIKENILCSGSTISLRSFESAASIAGVSEFARQARDGYGMNVGPRGGRLSGGQKQSIVLARALVSNPKVLLLDEPTASMDVAMEANVIEGLKSYVEGRTLILSTHRMALLQLVDRVIWLDNGRVVADKPRDEVMAMLRNNQQAAKAA